MRFIVVAVAAVLVLTGCIAPQVSADSQPFAQVSHSLTVPVGMEPTQAPIDTVESLQGIVNTGEGLIVPQFGCYFSMFAPQVGSAAGQMVDFQAWQRVNGEDVPNSNVLLRLGDDTKDVIISQSILCLQAGDEITYWTQASAAGVDLEAIDASPNPLVPSHTTTVFLVN